MFFLNSSKFIVKLFKINDLFNAQFCPILYFFKVPYETAYFRLFQPKKFKKKFVLTYLYQIAYYLLMVWL